MVKFFCVLLQPLLNIFWFYSTQFLSYIVPIFAWNVPLVSLIFLRSLVFPILLFSSISLHWSLRKDLLSLLAIFLELCIQISISFLFSFTFLSSSFLSYLKASSDIHFAFLHFFFLGMVLITASIDRFSGTLSIRSNPWNLFVTSTV